MLDWVHTFSSITPGLGVESTPDKLWVYTLSIRRSDQGQCLTCPVQYTLSILAQVRALPLPESRQTLKCCATTLPMVYHFHHKGCEHWLIKEPESRSSMCKPRSTHHGPYNDKFDTNIYMRIQKICYHAKQMRRKIIILLMISNDWAMNNEKLVASNLQP